jgi:hypothetical protein
VEQKAFFHTNTTGDSSHSDSARVASFAVATNNKTLKNLHTLFRAFFNFLVHFDRVATAHVDDCTLFKRLF